MSRRNIAREMAAGAPDILGPDLNANAYNTAYLAAVSGSPFVDMPRSQLSQPNVSASISEAYMDATLNGHQSSTLVPVVREVPEPRSLGAIVSEGLVTGAKITGLMFAGVVIGVGGANVDAGSSGYSSSSSDENQVSLKSPVTPIEEVGPPPKKKVPGVVAVTEEFANRWEEYCNPSGYPENDVQFPEEHIPDGVTQTKNGVYHVTKSLDDELILLDDKSAVVVDKGGYAPRIIACGDDMTVTVKGRAGSVALIGEQPWLIVGNYGFLARGYVDGKDAKASVNGEAGTLMAAGKSANTRVAGDLGTSILDNSFDGTEHGTSIEYVKGGDVHNRYYYNSDWS